MKQPKKKSKAKGPWPMDRLKDVMGAAKKKANNKRKARKAGKSVKGAAKKAASEMKNSDYYKMMGDKINKKKKK